MWARLASEFGLPTIEDAQRCINAKQFAEWQAYRRIEPAPADRTEYQLGIICALISNAMRQKGTQVRTPSDYMPSLMNSSKQQTGDEMHASFKAFMRKHNAGLKGRK